MSLFQTNNQFIDNLLMVNLKKMLLLENMKFFWSWFNWESDDPRRLVGDVILLVCYSVFFAAMTRAFVLLGLSEFLGLKRN